MSCVTQPWPWKSMHSLGTSGPSARVLYRWRHILQRPVMSKADACGCQHCAPRSRALTMLLSDIRSVGTKLPSPLRDSEIEISVLEPRKVAVVLTPSSTQHHLPFPLLVAPGLLRQAISLLPLCCHPRSALERAGWGHAAPLHNRDLASAALGALLPERQPVARIWQGWRLWPITPGAAPRGPSRWAASGARPLPCL